MEIKYVISGIIILISLIIISVLHYEKKRTEALKELARYLSFTFSKKGEDSLLSSLNQFSLFSKGYLKKITNVMQGYSNQINLSVMDYQFKTGRGKNSRLWRQTVILFQPGDLQIPDFVLKPENIFNKIGSAFGNQDIDFDSHPKFSKQYLLQSDDEKAIRNIFSDKVLSYFEQQNSLSVEINNNNLIFCKMSKRISPKDIRVFVEQGIKLVNLLRSKIK